MLEGTLLWQPTEDQVRNSNMSAFRNWLHKEKDLSFDSYADMWQWSVTDIEAFWESIWQYFDLNSQQPWRQVVDRDTMPGARWFEGTEINFAEQIALRSKNTNIQTGDRHRAEDRHQAGGRHQTEGRHQAEDSHQVNNNHPVKDKQRAGDCQPAGDSHSVDNNHPAVIFRSERHAMREVSREELLAGAASFQSFLKESGVTKGDRVAACLPNIPEAIMAFIAVSASGAVWSCCSPDFGAESAIDRFRQIDPKVFITADGYCYGGKDFDRMDLVARVQEALPSLVRTVVLPFLNSNPVVESLPKAGQTVLWTDLMKSSPSRPSGYSASDLAFIPVPFDHPLWILYSSGTTGLPKPITHSHGGMLVEQLKYLHLHVGLKPGDRFFWFTTTGWMMWNVLISSLLCGGTAVLYDGSPGWPDLNVLWEYASESRMSYFGTSAAYLMGSRKAGIEPSKLYDLSALRAVGSTGSPLPPEGYDWVYRQIGKHILLNSTSGGTDVCSSFVNGNPNLPVFAGEIQCRTLGASVEVFDDNGKSVINQAGEMVITRPMPCMPVCFWGDDDGSRYRESYFEHFPGVWRHGDLMKITDRGTCVIYGRSDATLNRMGVRIGTSEIYRAVEVNKRVKDSLIVSIEYEDGSWYMPLFVVAADGYDDADVKGQEKGKTTAVDCSSDREQLKQQIVTLIRERLSPKFTPDEIIFIDEIPYTLNGKKMEKPVRKILEGHKPEEVASLDSAKNPEALRQFVRFRRS